MKPHRRYWGILFMLLAALGFAVMGGAAKSLKGSFTAGQLVFFRNLVGLGFLTVSLLRRAPVSKGGKTGWLIFRGIIGTVALYGLLYCVLHLPLGTAMSYNLTSAIFIALFSFLLFREYNGTRVLVGLLIGFSGMLLIYKPNMDLPWFYHLAGLMSGIASTIAYITVGKLAAWYDTRVIVLSFIGAGVSIPAISMLLHYLAGIPADGILIIAWRTPSGAEWFPVLLLGCAALFGQYFVTLAYGADRAAIVSAMSYAGILFSVFIGMFLGDPFPDPVSWAGITCIIASGIMISLTRRKSAV